MSDTELAETLRRRAELIDLHHYLGLKREEAEELEMLTQQVREHYKAITDKVWEEAAAALEALPERGREAA